MAGDQGGPPGAQQAHRNPLPTPPPSVPLPGGAPEARDVPPRQTRPLAGGPSDSHTHDSTLTLCDGSHGNLTPRASRPSVPRCQPHAHPPWTGHGPAGSWFLGFPAWGLELAQLLWAPILCATASEARPNQTGLLGGAPGNTANLPGPQARAPGRASAPPLPSCQQLRVGHAVLLSCGRAQPP